MALGGSDGMVCCSTAAGPAFEGAHLSSGIGSVPGAVDHVEWIDGRMAFSTIDKVPAIGFCGSGVVDLVAFFVKSGLMDETGRLNRNFKEGRSTINAFLDDYSFTIQAFIALYQVSFDESWLQQAQKLAEYTLAHFYDDQSGMFFYTSDKDPGLIARKMELSDNVIPSSNSAMGRNLYLLGVYFDKPEYIDLSRQMLSNMKDDISSNVAYHTNWAQLMLSFIFPPSEVVIAGPKARELRTQLDQNFLPNIVLAGGTQKSSMPLMQSRFNPDMDLIYVCQGNVCKLPVGSVNEALVQIQDR